MAADLPTVAVSGFAAQCSALVEHLHDAIRISGNETARLETACEARESDEHKAFHD